MSGGNLQEYRRKRRFDRTPEPRGEQAQVGDKPRFVIQKHHASRLHYDMRLEIDGVLKSWAVPKGPSLDPSEKRLAMMTEDHPIEYAGFEGVIPRGEYGAGPVEVWDNGTFRNLDEERSLQEGVDKGHLAVWLEGKKLKGGFAITRMGKAGKKWLLVKMRDEEADPSRDIMQTEPESVLSGRNIDEIQ